MSAAAHTLDAPASFAQSFWARLYRISFTDVFLVAFLAWTFVASPGGWAQLLNDGDSGLHIRLGDYMLAHKAVPTTDMFSFGKPGQEWYAFEWLSEIALATVNSQFGLRGVVFFSGVLIALFQTTLLLYTLAKGTNALLAVVLALLSANVISLHYLARPHLFTLLFLTITLWMIDRDRKRPTWVMWLLIPLTVLWTNLHGGFFILFPLLGLLSVGCLLERQLESVKRYALLTVGCLLASLVNPYGYKLHQHIAETLSAKWILSLVVEFQSPMFRSESMLCFMAILFIGLGVGALFLERRQFVEPLWLAFFAYSSLISVRHITLFLIVAIPIVGAELTARWNPWVRLQPSKSVARIFDDIATSLRPSFRAISLVSVAGVIAVWFLTPASYWPTDFPKASFPVTLVERYGSQLAASKVFTSDQWAGFLLYHQYPRQKVFMDGRHNYYGEKVVNQYVDFQCGKPNWRLTLKQYGFDMILVASDSPLVSLLRTDPEWRVVAEADGDTLFTRLPHAG